MVYDTNQVFVVLKFFIDNTLVGIWSKDNSFNTALTGFNTINRGLNFNSSINQSFYGNADVANNLRVSGVSTPGSSFLLNTQNGIINGSLSLASDEGLHFGEDGDFEGFVTGNDVYLRNVTNNGDLVLSLKKATVNTPFYRDWETDRKSTRLNSSHLKLSRMPSSA